RPIIGRFFLVLDHHLAHAETSDSRCSWPTVIPAFLASKRSASSAIKPSARRALPSTVAAMAFARLASSCLLLGNSITLELRRGSRWPRHTVFCASVRHAHGLPPFRLGWRLPRNIPLCDGHPATISADTVELMAKQ